MEYHAEYRCRLNTDTVYRSFYVSRKTKYQNCELYVSKVARLPKPKQKKQNSEENRWFQPERFFGWCSLFFMLVSFKLKKKKLWIGDPVGDKVSHKLKNCSNISWTIIKYTYISENYTKTPQIQANQVLAWKKVLQTNEKVDLWGGLFLQYKCGNLVGCWRSCRSWFTPFLFVLLNICHRRPEGPQQSNTAATTVTSQRHEVGNHEALLKVTKAAQHKRTNRFSSHPVWDTNNRNAWHAWQGGTQVKWYTTSMKRRDGAKHHRKLGNGQF